MNATRAPGWRPESNAGLPSDGIAPIESSAVLTHHWLVRPRGGEKVILGFGAFSDQGVDYRPLGGPFIEDFQAVPRGPTIEPDDQGQYGVALKWFLPDFNQGTEFGFYFVNYHSKLPLISGRTGTQAGIANSLGTLTAAARETVGQEMAK